MNDEDKPKRNRRKSRVDIEIPMPALSVNKMYTGKKRRSVYYKHFRRNVFRYLNENLTDKGNLQGNLGLSLEVGVSSTLSDLSNCLKAIEDIMAEYLDFNDKQIVHEELDKYMVPKGEEYMKLSIYKVKKNIYRSRNAKEIRE